MRPIRVATPFTVTTLKPGAPTGLAGSVVSSIIVELTWDAQTWTVDGLVGTIEIQRSADNSTWATVHRVDGSLTAFDFPRVAAQQYFRIRAVFEGFASAWTSSVLINSAPVVTVPIAQSGTEDTNKSITGTSVSDADNPVSLSMTVAQTNGTISLAGITGLSFSVGDGTSDSTMTFTGSIANINTALATLTVIPTANYTGASAVTTITANDGHASPVSATITTTFSAVNDAPVVTCSGGTTAYVENDAATVVDGSLTVADVDSSTVTAMEAQITANFQTAEDVLAAPVDANGITWGSFNTGTGKIVATCSGTTTAQAQAALRLVTYENTSEAPNTSTRVVTFKVTDASSLQSTGATKSVSVAAVNDAPQINISGVQPAAVVMDSPYNMSSGGDISLTVSDADHTSLTMQLSVTHGTLSLGNLTGLTFSVGDGTNDATMTFSGTITNLNAAFEGMQYNPTTSYTGSDAVSIDAYDGTTHSSDSISILVS